VTPAVHAVEFYNSEDVLIDHLEEYVSEGRRRGETTIIVATAAHRRALSWRFVDGEDAFVGLDAAATLRLFMVKGRPHPALFEESVGSVVRALAVKGVRAYGEMVALLWAEGNAVAVLELEQLWNELQKQTSFPLLCAYPMADFERRDGIASVCDTHSHVGLPSIPLGLSA
jgi:hypothetical protein